MAKLPESFSEDDDIILSPLEDEDLTLESEEPAKKVEQKQPKKETKVEAKEEDFFTVAGKTHKRGQSVKLVVKKDDGSEYIEDWKFFGVTTYPSTGEKIIVIENKEGGKINYPMDMFEEGLGGRQLEMSLRFEAKKEAAKQGVVQEKRPSSAELLRLLKDKKARLDTAEKAHIAEWAKDSSRRILLPEIEKLEAQIREVKVGKGDAVEFIKVEDREFDKSKNSVNVKELTPEELAEISDEFSRLPVNIGGPNANRAIVRFLNVEGSSKKDLIIVLGPQEGRTISVDGKDTIGLSTFTMETSDLGPANVTKFHPREKLKFGKREINEVRLFVGSKVPEELREDLGDADLQKKTTDYVDRIMKKNKGKENAVSIPIINGLTGIDSESAWKIRGESNYGIEFATSLSGINSKRAWGYRERSFNGRNYYEAGNSLVGLDSPKAWAMRENILRASKAEKSRSGIDALVNSLAGLDSPEAWEMRERLSKAGSGESSLISSLTGLDSKKAWAMRDRLVKTRKKGDYIAEGVAKSLAGLDSPEAWNMRELLIARATTDGKGEESGEKNSVVRKVVKGLTGVDSERAWKMREELLKKGKFLDEIARSLAGIDLDRAWNMRGRLIIEGCHEDTVLQGIYGGTDMVAVRKARRDKIKKRK